MQHIASRQALQKVTDRLLAGAATLDDTGLGALGSDLQAVAVLLDREPGLRRTLSESTTSVDARAALVARLLGGKVGQPAMHMVDSAVRETWASGGDLRDGIDRLGRTALFLRVERSGELDEVEDQLFRFGRIVDANPDLSVLLDDPGMEAGSRAALVERVVGGRVHPLAAELLAGLARSTRGRSFSHGVRELVGQAAERKDKVVATVTAAAPLSTEQSNRLLAALTRIYGRPVAVHVVVDPVVQGGIRVQVGDEVIDGSISGRLETLRRSLAG